MSLKVLNDILHCDTDVIASEALHRMVYRAKRSNPVRLPRRPAKAGLLAMTTLVSCGRLLPARFDKRPYEP
jgi:hypothetical protein